MGDFGEGRKLARDGQTILDDANAFWPGVASPRK
jgi:hypothetical protein